MNSLKAMFKTTTSLLVAGGLLFSFLFGPLFAQGEGGMRFELDAQLFFGYPQVDSLFQDNDHDTEILGLILAGTRLGADANLFFAPLGETARLGGLLGVRGTFAPALKLTSSAEDNVAIVGVPVGITTLHEFDAFHLQPFLGVNNKLLMGDVSAYDLSILLGAKLLLSSWVVSLDYQWNLLLPDDKEVQLLLGQYVMQLGLGYRFSLM